MKNTLTNTHHEIIYRKSKFPILSFQYEFGTIARYHCQEGYTLRRLHGQDIYRCTSNGEWTPKIPPVCLKLEQISLNGQYWLYLD